VEAAALGVEDHKVYSFVVRRFLACCSDDARGQLSKVGIRWGNETFNASGLEVTQRNYLHIYPYEKWESSKALPSFTAGENIVIEECMMQEGKTSSPLCLIEPELISLMDKNGIGTDATMADHIHTVIDRQYVLRVLGNGNQIGGRRLEYLMPSNLGIALIEGFEKMGFEAKLSKPFLRKQMEKDMRDICEGKASGNGIVQQSLELYREIFVRANQQSKFIKDSCRIHLSN